MPPKKELPPLDTTGETMQAISILNRFRKTLDKLTPEWRDWIVKSLEATYDARQEIDP